MAAEALEQSVLESKDKDQLLAIAKALGLKANSRTKKAEIIDSILEMTGSSTRPGGDERRPRPRWSTSSQSPKAQRLGGHQRRRVEAAAAPPIEAQSTSRRPIVVDGGDDGARARRGR